MILGRDVESWADLDAAQLSRVLDALEGWVYVTYLRTLAGRQGDSML